MCYSLRDATAHDICSTSPSVYVVYEGISAIMDCGALYGIQVQGKRETITAAYDPGDLSTSVCHWGTYEPLNYTEMQYPPPNSALKGCYEPGWIAGDGTYKIPTNSPEKASPILSYPSNIKELKPAWAKCTAPYMGPWDPPRTLNKATAMVPAGSPTPPLAPGATAVPDQSPVTATPSPKLPPTPQSDPSNAASPQDPHKDSAQPAPSPADPGNPSPAVDPGVNSGSGTEQQPQSPKVDPTVAATQGSTSPNNNPSNNNAPNNPGSNNSPGNSNDPSGQSNPSGNSPANSNRPPDNTKNTANNDPVNSSGSPENSQPSNNLPSNNHPSNNQQQNNEPSNSQLGTNQPAKNQPSNNDPSKTDPGSNSPNLDSPSPRVNGKPQSAGNQNPAPGASNAAGSGHTQGLGGIIASALGYAPTPAAGPATGASNVPDTGPGGPAPGDPAPIAASPLSIVVDGVPTPIPSSNAIALEPPYIDIGGQHVTLSQASTNVILGGQTLAPGGPAITVSDTPISLPAPNYVPSPQAIAPVYNVGGHTITANPTAIPLKGTTLLAGDSAITISGTPVSLQPSGALVIGDSTVPVVPTDAGPASAGVQALAPVYTVGNLVVTANPTAIAVAGTTIIPGGSGVTIAGTAVSVPQSGGLVIGSSTVQVQPTSLNPASGVNSPLAPVYTVGGNVFTASPDAISIGGTTITPGGPGITVAGTPISLPQPGGLVIGGSTLPVQSIAGNPGSGGKSALAPVYTVGGSVFTASPNAIPIAGTTITSGGSGVTIAGTPISFGEWGSLIIGSSTVPVAPIATADSEVSSLFTVGGQIMTANPTAVSVDGTTITPGGSAVTVAGTPISLGTSGGLVIGTSTISLSPAITPFSGPAGAFTSLFTVGGQSFTANPTAISLAGTTIVPGGAGATVAGTPVSLGTSGNLVVGSSTIPLQPSAAASSASIYTVGGQTFTVNPTTISLAGTTIVPGGAGVTIAGTLVSLQSSGGLVIGSSTVAMSSPAGTGSSIIVAATPTQSPAQVTTKAATANAERRTGRVLFAVYTTCIMILLSVMVTI